jgi:hypothetical protein
MRSHFTIKETSPQDIEYQYYTKGRSSGVTAERSNDMHIVLVCQSYVSVLIDEPQNRKKSDKKMSTKAVFLGSFTCF